MPETATVSKAFYNDLKNNLRKAESIIKTLKKREKKDLPLDVQNSSQISLSANVVIDLTGKRPVTKDGEIADQDLLPVPRKKAKKARKASKVVKPRARKPQVEEKSVPSIKDARIPSASKSKPTVHSLSSNLKGIVDKLYEAVDEIDTTHPLPHVVALDLEEFSFDPQDIDGSPIKTLKRICSLAVNTEKAGEQTYALRCYNSFKMEREWITSLALENPTLSRNQISYSLKQRYIDSFMDEYESDAEQLDDVEAGETGRRQKELDLSSEWTTLKRCTKRGKPLVDLMELLDLGSALFLANVCWSDIYDLSIAKRDSVVKFILADLDNHQMIVDACSYFDVDDHADDEEEQKPDQPDEEEEKEDSYLEEEEFDDRVMSWEALNDDLHYKFGHGDVITSFTEVDDVQSALQIVEDWMELDQNADYLMLAQLWVDKFHRFLEEEAELDEDVKDLDDGPVEFGTAVPVIQIAVNPQPNPTPAVPPVKQRRLGLSRRALASRPVN